MVYAITALRWPEFCRMLTRSAHTPPPPPPPATTAYPLQPLSTRLRNLPQIRAILRRQQAFFYGANGQLLGTYTLSTSTQGPFVSNGWVAKRR
jgi:hypothetical protein